MNLGQNYADTTDDDHVEHWKSTAPSFDETNSIQASTATSAATTPTTATAAARGGLFEDDKYDIDESNVESSSTASLDEVAAQWQQSLKRQSFDQGRSSRRATTTIAPVAADGEGPATTLLLMPCSTCLPSNSELVAPSTTTTTRWNDTTDSSYLTKKPSRDNHRRMGQLKSAPSTPGTTEKPEAVPVTPNPFVTAQNSAFVMPDTYGGFAVPMKRVQSFGTATTASVTTCETMTPEPSHNHSYLPATWQEATAIDIIPTSSTQMALEDSDCEDGDWDASSTTTTEVVSHCQNPFRERFSPARGEHRMNPEDSSPNNNEAYRYLKRMSPHNYVHEDDSSDDDADCEQELSRAYSNDDILEDLSQSSDRIITHKYYYSHKSKKSSNKRWKSTSYYNGAYNNYHYSDRDLLVGGSAEQPSVSHSQGRSDPAAPIHHQFGTSNASHWLQPRPTSFTC